MGLREAGVAGVVALPFVLGLSAAGDQDRPRTLLRLIDPAIVESSGLVARDGLLHTVNDSGDGARVFTVDDEGRTVGVSRWQGEAVDVEALAPGPPGRVWVGDLGDNSRSRESVSVVSVPVGRGEPEGSTPRYRLAHPQGATDAEALLAHPRTGRLYVATKGVLGGRLLAAPRRLDARRVGRLRPVGDVMGVVTDGAFLPDGRHLVLRDYTRAVVYTFPGLEQVAEVRLPRQRQGEGLAVRDGSLLLSSEGPDAPVLAVDLPTVDGGGENAEPSADPSPQPSREPGRDSSAAPPAPDVRSWLIGLAVLGVMVVVLVRSLRPR